MKNFLSIAQTILLLLSLTLFFQGCTPNKRNDDPNHNNKKQNINSSEPFMIITDSRGIEVTIPKSPQRIISLGPNMTEIIFALERGDLLVGRTDYCDYPQSVTTIPSVGDIRKPNLELIVELDPDLIFASTHVTPQTIARLEKFGICVVALEDSGNFEGLQTLILDCAKILSAEEMAAPIVKKIEQQQNKIKLRAKDIDPLPSVYFALGFGEGGDWTAGANTFIDDMITIAGGVNIVENQGWSYSKEMLVEKDPDIILIGEGKKEEFTNSRIYRDLSASQRGTVYEIDEDIITRTSPRAIEGLKRIQEIFIEFRQSQIIEGSQTITGNKRD